MIRGPVARGRVLTAGRAGDAPRAHAPLAGSPAGVVIADAAEGARAVVPGNPSRTRRLPLDAHLYEARHRVECCSSKLKRFRRAAPAATVLRLR